MGVTVMIATGDNGVANFGCPCNSKKRTSYYNCACQADSGSSASDWTGAGSWSGTGYFPSFPATCPYVTAVGATMGPEDGDPEIACQSQLGGIITSGGGFSTFYSQPSWQTTAVNAYFNAVSGTSQEPASGYNPNGRAIPDISLIGVAYQVVVAGTIQSLYGTSASTPVFAAFISLLNAERNSTGQPNVGFINPTLYNYGSSGSTANLFNDITSGNNMCCANSAYPQQPTTCCSAGFYATPGWDPVTGWGSINYPNLQQIFSPGPTPFPTPFPLPTVAPTLRPTVTPGQPTPAPTAEYFIVLSVSQVNLIDVLRFPFHLCNFYHSHSSLLELMHRNISVT